MAYESVFHAVSKWNELEQGKTPEQLKERSRLSSELTAQGVHPLVAMELIKK